MGFVGKLIELIRSPSISCVVEVKRGNVLIRCLHRLNYADDHNNHRQCIGWTHLPCVVSQECPPPRRFLDRSLDCTEIIIVRTR